MRNRVPAKREERAPLPDFAPVPRKYRHDGWTPERQKAFIEALADCGSVTRAAAQVNMAQANCYTLRRAPGAEEFRRAWDAALDFGVKRLKDIAFERAIEGQLFPVFQNGKLMGFSRKRNDALLMFCLRHYGQDGEGRTTTVNYFATRASAGAGVEAGAGSLDCARDERGKDASTGSARAGGDAGARAEASATTIRTVVRGGLRGAARGERGLDGAAAVLNGFAGLTLDAEAEAEIRGALEACAARARATDAAGEAGGEAGIAALADDPGESFVRLGEAGLPYRGELVPVVEIEDFAPFTPGEAPWKLAGAEKPAALVEWEEARAGEGLKRDA